jgi:putative DNA primase/helicase
VSDLRKIARALGGEVIGRDRVLAPGPGHSNKDRSLSVRVSQHAADGFVVHSFAGDDWRECHHHVRSLLGTAPPAERPPVRPRWGRQMSCSSDSADEEARVARALEIWDQAQDPRGTLVERYLTRGRADGGRGLEFPHDCAHRVLRFHSKCPWRDEVSGQIVRVPAMIAVMRCIRTNAIKAVHRRRLDINGEKIGKPRMLGAAGGTAVKLDPDPCVTLGLVVGEGVETCLSARQLG